MTSGISSVTLDIVGFKYKFSFTCNINPKGMTYMHITDKTLTQLYTLSHQRWRYPFKAYLDDNQKADTRAKISGITVHSSHNIHDSLTNGNDHTKH